MRFALENIAFDPSDYIMDHAILVASICMGESISTMRGPRKFFFFLDEGREDPNTTKSGPSSTRQRNAI